MPGALGAPLPARASLQCSTSGRVSHTPSHVAGRRAAVKSRAHVRCCAKSSNNANFNLGSGQPFDSLDAEWQALSRQRSKPCQPSAAYWLPDDTSIWDMIDIPEFQRTTPDASCMEEGHQDTKNRFWQYSPASTTSFWDALSRVHVILFGVGEGDPEGIYSVRAMPGADQLPQETIIAFENAEDATRYANRLEATMDRAPNVVPITPSELLEFCLESGYNCRLEQSGSMLTPPDFNVDITDWERSLRLRNGQWSVVDDSIDQSEDESQFTYMDSNNVQQPHNNAGVYLPSENGMALDELRTRLERLMQLDG